MAQSRRRFLAATASLSALIPLSACGTLLHPERKGQTGGRIDPSIAILNGIGLLLFIIPGLVAFAIDFSNGTIYLPGTGASKDGYSEYAFEGELTEDKLNEVWRRHYGEDAPFKPEELQRMPLGDRADIGPAFASVTGRRFASL